MNALRLILLAAALFVTSPAWGGTARQTTSFLVGADENAACHWIEQNQIALDRSSGAQIVAVHGPETVLHKDTKEGPLTFVVRHDFDRHGQYDTVLVRSDNANLLSEKTEIRVEPEGDHSRVTITVVATVSGHSSVAISIGIRPSMRSMRKLMESQLGAPTDQ
jgi:hypothetical protein